MSGTDNAALRQGQQVPFALHTIGGRHPDGTPISLGPWTFECPQVRDVVESYLRGRVLNACAGKTRLRHDGEVHRNDLDGRREADTHHDVTTLDDYLPTGYFETVVFDPPFDPEQADEHYAGHKVGRGPSGGIWQARDALATLTSPDGLVLSIGWNSVGLQHKDAFEREAVHLFQRVQKPDVILTVDRRVQRTIRVSGSRSLQTGTEQSEGSK